MLCIFLILQQQLDCLFKIDRILASFTQDDYFFGGYGEIFFYSLSEFLACFEGFEGGLLDVFAREFINSIVEHTFSEKIETICIPELMHQFSMFVLSICSQLSHLPQTQSKFMIRIEALL
jgi:hypothetical protein